MAERTEKIILETEYKTTGVDLSVQKLDALVAASNKVTKSNTEKVAADKKVEQAANQLNKTIETQTQKNNALSDSIQKTGKAMQQIASTNKLKEAFTGAAKEVDTVAASLKKFEEAAKAAGSVDELTQAVDELLAALPEDIRADAFKFIQKETEKLEKTLERPTARLRELKRLINTTDDPVVLKKLTAEAAKLQDELGDTNDLIKSLASDTLLTDTLVQGAQTATAAFSAFQGVTTLIAEDNEELAKAAQKAQGAMAALLGIQQLAVELKRKDSIVTKAQELAQRGYNTVVGESTGATRAFRVALASIGIGLLVGAIITLVSNWEKWRDAITGSNAELRRNEQFRKQAIEATVEETTKIEIAKAALRDSNTTQKQRIEILNELKEQYPAYLKNIDAETSSYEDVEAALNRVNQALFIKSSIQVRETAISELQKDLFELEQQIEETETKAVKFRNAFARDAEERGLNEFFALTAENQVKALQENARGVTAEINKLIQDVVNKSQDLTLIGGDPTKNADKTKAAIKQTEQIIDGTIAALQKRVTELSDQLTNELVVGSEEFTKVVQQFIIAQDALDEARKKLGRPEKIDLFTAGSLNALEKQVKDIETVLSGLGAGVERTQLAEKLKEAQAELAALRKELFGEEQAQEEEFNTAFLDEAERNQEALLRIEGAGEDEIRNQKIAFAKERLEILREQGKGETDEAQRIENQITELEAEAAKEREENRKAETQARIEGAKQLLSELTAGANALLQIEIDRFQALTDAQQQRVNEATEIADKGNVKLLELEEKRLEDLNAKREKFVLRQRQLAQAQLVAESLVAVAKAAAEGGAAAPFTIAATLTALLVGLAQARAQAQSLSFKKGGIFDPSKGGYTGVGPESGQSMALGPKPYEYHFKEHIMPANVTGIGDNLRWLERIRLDRIDIGKMMKDKPSPVMIQANDNSDVVEAIKSIKGVTVNLSAKGITTIVEESEFKKKRVRAKR